MYMEREREGEIYRERDVYTCIYLYYGLVDTLPDMLLIVCPHIMFTLYTDHR